MFNIVVWRASNITHCLGCLVFSISFIIILLCAYKCEMIVFISSKLLLLFRHLLKVLKSPFLFFVFFNFQYVYNETQNLLWLMICIWYVVILFYTDCNEDFLYPGMRCANTHFRIGPSTTNTTACTQVEIQTSFFAALDSGFWIVILDCVVTQRHFCHQNQATGSTELWVQPTSWGISQLFTRFHGRIRI